MSDELCGGFRASPFFLDDQAVAWLERTLAGMTVEERIKQLLMHESKAEAGAGGVFLRCGCGAAALRGKTEKAAALPGVPLLAAADLEFTAHGRISDLCDHPCQMAVGASGDSEAARRMGIIAGEAARDAGIDWNFSPVADLALNHRSPSVNIRAFGADAELAAEMTAAYVEGIQKTGIAATAKHWPGDGLDERDQHYTTARNPLPVDQWRDTFGRVFRAAVESGVKAVMSAHISFPAYARSKREPDSTAFLPASLSRLLNEDLLRGELGFGGVIVTDGLSMGGATSRMGWAELAPAAVAAGCDMVLFPPPAAETIAYFQRALRAGTLSARRVEEAAARVLALKASLGLHRRMAVPSGAGAGSGSARARRASREEQERWAKDCAERSLTLVKNSGSILPLSPDRTPRILLFVSRPEVFVGEQRPFILDRLLEERGFETTLYRDGTVVDRDLFDLLLYAVEEQPVFIAESLTIKWRRFGANHRAMLRRYWKDFPVLFVSLGSPFHPFEIPACPAIVNAYSSALPVQEALAAALAGELPFRGTSPVDPFCGAADESE